MNGHDEEGKKMIVETETVDASTKNLLPVQPVDTEKRHSKSTEQLLDLLQQQQSDTEPGQQQEATNGSAANLINHNPLSTHNNSVALRNRKSSLLIDSLLPSKEIAVPQAMDIEEEVPATTQPQQRIQNTSSPIEDGTDNDSTRKSKEPSTKADFFAARLASAVGENEISDSEETFVYESTANSTNNATPSGSLDIHGLSTNNSNNKPYGIPPKLSVPLLNNKAKLLNRLKNTRHTSIAVMPSSPALQQQTQQTQQPQTQHQHQVQQPQLPQPQQQTPQQKPQQQLQQLHQTQQSQPPLPPPLPQQPHPPANPNSNANANANANASAEHYIDDLTSVRSLNRQSNQDIKSVKSYKTNTTFPNSPGKRLSLVSLAKGAKPTRHARKISVNSTVRHPPVELRKKMQQQQQLQQHQYQHQHQHQHQQHQQQQHQQCQLQQHQQAPNRRQLRTTASKLFDANGASLRRYSGVPDDVNLEDYIEQAGGELTPNVFSYHSDSDLDIDGDGLSFVEDVDEQGERGEEDEDAHSMFYYHGTAPKHDLEARPQIADYDQDGLDQEQLYYYPDQRQYEYIYHPTEATPLKPRRRRMQPTGYSPHNFYTKKSNWSKFKTFVYFAFVVISLLTLGFISGFLLATNKELHDLNITIIDNVLASTDELVFDITVSAFNPGFFTISVQDVAMDIFAKTSHLRLDDDDDYGSSYQTIRLGTVYSLETPLQFQGGFFNRNYDVSLSSVKLLHPGATDDDQNSGGEDTEKYDKRHTIWSDSARSEGQVSSEKYVQKVEDGVDKWKTLMRYEFELIIRGNMKYTIPFFNSEKSFGVQKSVTVDPNGDANV